MQMHILNSECAFFVRKLLMECKEVIYGLKLRDDTGVQHMRTGVHASGGMLP